MFGYAVLMGDIRVTGADGKTFDGVRKVAGISNSIAGGFAGNIYQGLSILEHLTAMTKLPDQQAWKSEFLIENLPTEMRRVFEGTKEKAGGENARVEIMLVGVDPVKNVPQDTPWPLPYCYIFRSPYFSPEKVEIGKVDSIGSGSSIDAYVEELENLSNPRQAGQLMQLEVGNPGGFGQVLSHIIGGVAGRQTATDVSPHLITCVIKRNDMTQYDNNRSQATIANNWEELLQLAGEQGFSSDEAKAFIA